MQFITFFLAFIGYLGLALNTILVSHNKYNRNLVRLTVVIIVIHVLFVWWFHYQWQFSQAVRNGYFGFALFHSALIFIVLSAFLSANKSKILIVISFLIVTIGANGAVFRYDVVSIYRYPIIAISVMSVGILVKNIWKKNISLQ